MAAHTKLKSMDSTPRDGSITVLQRIEDIKAVAKFWRSHQDHPDADIDFFVNERFKPDFIRPHIVVLRSHGKLKCIVVGAIWKQWFDFKIGYQELFKVPATCIVIPHGGVLGRPTASDGKRIIQSLLSSIRCGQADAVCFNYINPKSSICQAAQTLPPLGCRDSMAMSVPHYRIKLPSTFADIYKRCSRNTKGNIRNVRNRIEKKYKDRFCIACYTDVNEIDTAMADIESIARHTYQRALGAGFFYSDETRRKWRLAARNGNLRVFVLYLDNQPCSFITGIICRNLFLAMSTGYKPATGSYQPGKYILIKALEYLCKEDRIDTFDFGFGDARYKREFATETIEENVQYIFAPTILGLCLNILRIATVGTNHFSIRLLERLNLIEKIKTGWRHYLAMGK